MDKFLLAASTLPHWSAAVDDCLTQLETLPSVANLAFLYLTDEHAANAGAILSALQAAAPGVHWVGTVGLGICCTGREFYEEPAIAMLVAALPADAFRVFAPIKSGFGEFIERHAHWYRSHHSHLGVVHGDPDNPATPQLIGRLAEELPGGFLVGGLSSSREQNPQFADALTGGGLSGVLLAPEVAVVTGLSQGCSPIGPRHRVTECQRNIAIQIDQRPALEVFNEDIGEVLARDLRRVAGYIFAGFPISGSDTGDYLVRNLVGVDPERQLLAVGDLLHQGQEVMFCRRDGNSAREDLERMLKDLTQRASRPPRGAVYHSCLGRGRYLFGDDSAELKLIQDYLGDCPLVGFYANGEVFHNRLYGYTGVLTLFL